MTHVIAVSLEDMRGAKGEVLLYGMPRTGQTLIGTPFTLIGKSTPTVTVCAAARAARRVIHT